MFKDSLYNFIGAFVRLLLSAFSIPILLSVLGPENYGLYVIIMSIVTFATLFEWSISLLLTVFIAKDIADLVDTNDTLRTAFFVVILLSTITGLGLWFFSPYLALFFDDISIKQTQVFINGCRLATLFVVARLFQQYFIGLEQGHNNYKLMNILTTAYHITLTALVLLFALLYKSIVAILLVQVILTIIGCLTHTFYCWRNHYFKHLNLFSNVELSHFTKMLKYSFKIYTGALGSVLFNQGDRIIVGKLLGIEIAGIYAAFTSIVTQINTLSAIPVQPIVSRIISEENQFSCVSNTSIYSIINHALLLNATLAVGIGSVVFLIAPEIVSMLFHINTHENLVVTLRILTVAYVLYSFNAVGYYLLFALRLEWINTIVNLFCGVCTLLLITLLAWQYGIIGAVIGNLGYASTLCLLFIGFKKIAIKPQDVLKTVYLPLIVFVGSIFVGSFIENTYQRLIFSFVGSLILIRPFVKELQVIIGRFWNKATTTD